MTSDVLCCTFLNCSSDRHGGALYFHGFRLTVLQSSTFSCAATSSGSSLYAQFGTSPSTLQFSDGTLLSGFTDSHTFLFYPGISSGSECSLERANITGNTAPKAGAGALLDESDTLRFQFCEIQSNEGSNCISLWGYNTGLIRCISIRSNLADGSAERQGIFFGAHSLTISESAIVGNNATLLVQSGNSSALFTFSNCHFDTFEQTASVAIFEMVGCFTDGKEFLGLPRICLEKTGTFTQSLQALFSDRKMLIVRFACFFMVVWDTRGR